MGVLRAILLDVPEAALARLGRQGTRAIAALVFIGIAVPRLDALLKPFVSEAIFVLLCIAFLRVDLAALRGHMRKPIVVLAATAWTMLAVPILFGASCRATGLEANSPDLLLALMLQAVASPMMAAPALAALMGLDATLVLVTLITSTALTPITAPFFIYAFAGGMLTIPAMALGLKLFGILSGSLLVGVLARRIIGATAIQKYRDGIDGLNILVVFVFVAAVMENLAASFLTRPKAMVELAAIAWVIFIVVFGLTALVFSRVGWARAFVLGLMASQRNMGLMLAVTAGALPDLVWLYFALSQFPIYLSPPLMRPMARRLVARAQSIPESK